MKWFVAVVFAIAATAVGEESTQHWAFQVPTKPAPPAGHGNPIDGFIAAKHAEIGLQPAPSAAPERLLRRVHLDLTGLPPTREELRAFRENPDYERVVEQLLNSPAYGERWGRHWMDIWRYSDWFGRRKINDIRNSHIGIWRWRDWIIESLNEDLGYDQMLRLMLAADEIAPGDAESQAALGFIVRNWFLLNYNPWKQDQVEHTAKAFLGLRLNCALCHDHKYDPISQRDYFAFRAFFEPMELRMDRVPGAGAVKKFVAYPNNSSSLKPTQDSLPGVYDFRLDAETAMYANGDSREVIEGQPVVAPDIPKVFGSVADQIKVIDLPELAWYPGIQDWIRAEELEAHEKAVAEAKTEHDLKAAEAELALLKLKLEADLSKDPEQIKEGGRLQTIATDLRAQARLANAKMALAKAEALPESDEKRKSKIAEAKKELTGAENSWKAREKANPFNNYTPLSALYPKQSTSRRTALANWIASELNPLTARVAVNHIWNRHFGKALVDTVFDFGVGGAEPVNQQLLDWLAVELMESGWSMKHIHRLIVTSNAYRMSSTTSGKNAEIDPDNRFLWRFPPRRLEAEVIRDSILASCGRLESKMGGPSIDRKLEAETTRRSLYFEVFPEEGGLTPFLAAFDGPDTTDCYERTESVVPQQALAMVNSRMVHDSSEALAEKLGGLEDSEFILAVYESILTRSPTEAEFAACGEFLAQQDSSVARAGLIRALFSHDDFVMLK